MGFLLCLTSLHTKRIPGNPLPPHWGKCVPSMMPITLGHMFYYPEGYVLAGLWA